MPIARLLAAFCAIVIAVVVAPDARADTPLAAAHHVPCPIPTDEPARYAGVNAPFRCSSAVTDPDGLVVVLREGRAAAAGPGPFGLAHASAERGVEEDLIARIVSSVRPVPGEQRRLHYVAEVGEVSVWVVVDRGPSRQAPDTRPFGLITAFCTASPDGIPQRCPERY